MRGLVLLFCLMSMSAQAGGMPVFDPLNWIQNKLNALENTLTQMNTRINNQTQIIQIRQKIRQLEQMERQWKQVQRQYEALSGKNGYGQWLNGPARLLDPSYKPKDINDWRRILSTGKTHSKITKGNSDNDWNGPAYTNPYSVLPRDKAYPRNPNSRRAWQEEQHAYKTGAVNMTARQIYATIEDRQEAIDEILKLADNAETMKQAMDINNVFLSELNRNMIEILHLQATLAQMQSAGQQGQVERERGDALFNRY
ncbi:MAG: hypothetical protein OEY58_19830 [Gammaproteobacteria bacterium]|nr:hypothetical protein [Gammaproteobacteria bacterium]